LQLTSDGFTTKPEESFRSPPYCLPEWPTLLAGNGDNVVFSCPPPPSLPNTSVSFFVTNLSSAQSRLLTVSDIPCVVTSAAFSVDASYLYLGCLNGSVLQLVFPLPPTLVFQEFTSCDSGVSVTVYAAAKHANVEAIIAACAQSTPACRRQGDATLLHDDGSCPTAIVAASANGSAVISCSGASDNPVLLELFMVDNFCDDKPGSQIKLDAPCQFVTGLAFLPQSRLFAISSLKCGIWLMSTDKSQRPVQLSGMVHRTGPLLTTRDGLILASAEFSLNPHCAFLAGWSFSRLACSQCLAGSAKSYFDAAIGCQPCSPGFATAVVGAATCNPCDVGTYRSAQSNAGVTCFPCESGKFSNTTGAESCYSCPKGKYGSTQATVCTDCEAGTFSSFDGLPCRQCAAGSYQVQ